MAILRKLALIAVFVVALSSPGQAAQAESVDLVLVLAADVSRSIDSDEFVLQRQGYAAALTNSRVLRAIQSGINGAIAVCFIEWGSPDEQQVVSDWLVIRDGASARVFADRLVEAPRSFLGRTSISSAIDFSVAKIAASGFDASRRVIDISGDGTNNAGGSVVEARDRAVKAGIVINGLAINNENPSFGFPAHTQPTGGLPAYYRANVIGGTGAFLLVIEDFNSFGEAITNKVLTEIVSLPARRDMAEDLHDRWQVSP